MAAEIVPAARAVRVRAQQCAIARQQVQSWAADVDKTATKQGRGRTSFADNMSARLGLLKAASAEVDQATAWQLARVELVPAKSPLARQAAPPPSLPAR